jgi:hypothetical protein
MSEFDNIPIKGNKKLTDEVQQKIQKELVDKGIKKNTNKPIPSAPPKVKLNPSEAMRILKDFLLNEGINVVSGNFGGWQLWLKVIIVLGILSVILFGGKCTG